MIKNFLDDVYIIDQMSSRKFDEFEDYKLLTPSEIYESQILSKIKKQKIKKILSSIGIIKIKDIKKNKENKILGLYNKKEKVTILFKKQKKYPKKYQNLNDLTNDNDIAIFVNDDPNNVEITGYQKSDKKILFYGKISNIPECDDIKPYNCSFVECSAADREINAKNILYPLLAYYADDNLIISDRSILTHKAKSVWLQFYKNNGIIDRFLPLDDSKLFSVTNHKNICYYKNKKIIKNKMLPIKKRLKILKVLKKEQYLDWVFKLNSEFKKNNEFLIEILVERHEKSKKLEKELDKLSDSFFHQLIY
jgi:hypothetical protein